jgi:hypothetical protein
MNFFITLITLLIGLTSGMLKQKSELSIMKQVYVFEAVKLFCSSQNLSTNFCSNENLKYMFWDRPSDYVRLIEYLSNPKKYNHNNQAIIAMQSPKKTAKPYETLHKIQNNKEKTHNQKIVKLNHRRFQFMSEFSQPRYL